MNMKNTLAENLLRFGVKNLSEETKQKLVEQGASTTAPVQQFAPIKVTGKSKLGLAFKGKTFPLTNFIKQNSGAAELVMGPNSTPLSLNVANATYMPADPAAKVGERVVLNIRDNQNGRFVNFDLAVYKNSAAVTKIYHSIDGINAKFPDGTIDPLQGNQNLTSQLNNRSNFENNTFVKAVQSKLV
jgi:hypothetical protein